jgi:hypothetical protein
MVSFSSVAIMALPFSRIGQPLSEFVRSVGFCGDLQ